jgi:hypothetical protein
MKVKLHAKVLYEWDYEADSKWYGTENIGEMIKMEKKVIADDPFLSLQDRDPVIEITIK